MFKFSACPLNLFSAIACTSNLRHRAAYFEASSAETLYDEAMANLRSIEQFSLVEWSASKPVCKPEWELLGIIYQSAAALYCISSMQSLSVFPSTTRLNTHLDTLTSRLEEHLQTAFLSPRVDRFLFWPLMVLGVAAARGSDAMRISVARELSRMSFRMGTCVPFITKGLLEKFWGSGETHWDACFNHPYVLTTQIAFDTSRLGHG